MIKIITPVSNGGLPIYNGDLVNLQNELFTSINSGYYYFTNEAIILKGCEVSNINVTASTLTISSGYTFINNDIVKFNGYNGVYPAYINSGTTIQSGKTFHDGITRNAVEEKTLQVSLSAPTGGTKYITFNPNTSQRYDYIIQRYSKKIGDIISYAGSLSSFDGTGLGKWDMLGFALCNGSNGTVDLRQRFIVGYNPSTGDYDTIGKTGGSESITLDISQIPSHDHTIRLQDRGANGTTDGFYGNTGSDVDITSDSKGGGLSHENRPPYYVLAFYQRIN